MNKSIITASLKVTVELNEEESAEEATFKATEQLLNTIQDWVENEIPPYIEFQFSIPNDIISEINPKEYIN